MRSISRRVNPVIKPPPWEAKHMRLAGVRFAESVTDPCGMHNVTLGVIRHLWRSPVPFVGLYPPEGVKITGSRLYVPSLPRPLDDTDYLAGIEAHKCGFANYVKECMIPSGELPGYFEVPTEEGWRIALDLVGQRLALTDGRGVTSNAAMIGNVAPFVWAYRNCGFCVVTLYDKDISALRDDLLFVAKRKGVEFLWSRKAA
jgi:hypothetical protein